MSPDAAHSEPKPGSLEGSTPNTTSHPDFAEALSLSSDLTAHLRSLDVSRLMYRAAVIDRQHVQSHFFMNEYDGDGGSTKAEKGKGKVKSRTEWTQLEIMGWSRFLQSLERQHAALEQQASRKHSTDPRDSPLPPILSSLTLTKTVLSAPKPITGVRVTMGSKDVGAVSQGGKGSKLDKKVKGKNRAVGGRGEEEVVDVICRGGAEWIKLWTKKESQMLAEFREQDSYATSDWSDSDDSAASSSSSKPIRSSPTPPGLTNSLLTTARSLVSLTQTSLRCPGAPPPRLTIRLTRMSPTSPESSSDPRISETFAILRSLGINLQFGDLSQVPLRSLPRPTPAPRELLPSLKINLDPTALVGLCADALHHPVPTGMDQARRRYFRPRRYLSNGTSSGSTPASGTATPISTEPPIIGEMTKDDLWLDGYDDHRQSQHSRELLKEAMDEVRAPLIDELRDTLQIAIDAAGGVGDGRAEFWTTEGSLQHLKEAMSNTKVVGEGMEQQRMRRLIGLEDGDFWEGSRYQGKEGCLSGLKIRIFDDRPIDNNASIGTPQCPDGLRSLHVSTAATARLFLSEYRATTADPSLLKTAHSDIPPFLRPDRLPVPKVAELSVPLPIVSLASMQRGAEEGMTTLCMGNVVWREMFAQGRWKVRGWTQGNWEVERSRLQERRRVELGRKMGEDGGRVETGAEEADGEEEIVGGEEEGNAVIWLMPYRSLGEGKRVRFERGDYSFPVPK